MLFHYSDLIQVGIYALFISNLVYTLYFQQDVISFMGECGWNVVVSNYETTSQVTERALKRCQEQVTVLSVKQNYRTWYRGCLTYKVMSYECSEIRAVYSQNEIVLSILFPLLTKSSNLAICSIFTKYIALLLTMQCSTIAKDCPLPQDIDPVAVYFETLV